MIQAGLKTWCPVFLDSNVSRGEEASCYCRCEEWVFLDPEPDCLGSAKHKVLGVSWYIDEDSTHF